MVYICYIYMSISRLYTYIYIYIYIYISGTPCLLRLLVHECTITVKKRAPLVIVLVHHILCLLLHDRNVYKMFSALNLTITHVNLFTCNKRNFSVSFSNKILFLPLNIFFIHAITDCI